MDELSMQSVVARPSVETVNAHHWPSRRQARRRTRRQLGVGELTLLVSYRRALAGAVLELGSRGDRLTGLLAAQSHSLIGLGRSTPTVELCRSLHPTARFLERDIRDLDSFEDGQFAAVVAGHAEIDLLGDAQRRLLFDRLRRILAPDGVLIFSSHNLGCESLVPPPGHHLGFNPLRAIPRLARLPLGLGNRAQLGRLQEREHGYAILNTPAEDYSLLHYHISRDAQERQLGEHGFLLLECLAPDGAHVDEGSFAYRSRQLHYAATPGL
jgi:SAM-dependent methyltransferase